MSGAADDPEPTPRAPKTLVALTVLGPVLIVAAVAGMIFAQYQFSVRNDGYSGTQAPDYIVAAQVIYQIAPAVLTGGLVCLGLALGISALRSSRLVQSWEAGAVGDERSTEWAPIRTDSLRREPDTDAPTGSEPEPPRILDPEAFKRPRADRHPAS